MSETVNHPAAQPAPAVMIWILDLQATTPPGEVREISVPQEASTKPMMRVGQICQLGILPGFKAAELVAGDWMVSDLVRVPSPPVCDVLLPNSQ